MAVPVSQAGNNVCAWHHRRDMSAPMFFTRSRTVSLGSAQDKLMLRDTAHAVYQTALDEKLPLAHIAEQSGLPHHWFANNILHVVHVLGRRTESAGHEVLTQELIRDLKLNDDMTVLILPGEKQPKFLDLQVAKEECKRYLDWARTVY